MAEGSEVAHTISNATQSVNSNVNQRMTRDNYALTTCKRATRPAHIAPTLLLLHKHAAPIDHLLMIQRFIEVVNRAAFKRTSLRREYQDQRVDEQQYNNVASHQRPTINTSTNTTERFNFTLRSCTVMLGQLVHSGRAAKSEEKRFKTGHIAQFHVPNESVLIAQCCMLVSRFTAE